ncbi:MAG: hypothetical protein EAY66_05450 [Sphingobacteriales bacterium]|nr:MAG: hypothetical protein EAY66_05450 [Sphingobacteriales bacterium]
MELFLFTKVSEVNNEVVFYLFYLKWCLQPALCLLRFSFAFFAVKIYHKEHKDLRKVYCLYIQLIL